MTPQHDIVVLGGGPAGAAAAMQAHALNLSVLLVDEQPAAGGQVHRAPSGAITTLDRSPGDLRTTLRRSGVAVAFERRAWLLAPGFDVRMIGPHGSDAVETRALILATGAQERIAPVTGWTLPGVIGLAGATALIKAQKILPGDQVVVAGRGPLLLLVAKLILEGGGGVVAIIDEAAPGDWMAGALAMASRPDLMVQGGGWLAYVAARGVPIHFQSAVRRMIGTDRVEAVEIVSRRKPEASPLRLPCDAVCYGHGLTPATEPSRQLGASHSYRPELGGWTVITDHDQRTDVPLLYACGDGAGVLGAAAAPLRGRLAALAAARDLGALSPQDADDAARPIRRQLERASRFGGRMTAMTAKDLDLIAHAEAETLICRCESLSRTTLEAAIKAGAHTPNGLKAATRCGMGPCGGKFCGETAAALIAACTGQSLHQVGQMTSRPPLRPLAMSAIMGGFSYEDIPFPEPAPL